MTRLIGVRLDPCPRCRCASRGHCANRWPGRAGGGLFANSDVIAQTSSRNIGIFGAGGGLDRTLRVAHGMAAVDGYGGGFDTNDTNQITDIVRNNLRLSTGPVFRF